MEWLLIAHLPTFILLASLIKPLYEKWYDRGIITFNGPYEPKLIKYLQQFQEEAKIRANIDLHRDRGYTPNHLDKPEMWKKELRSPKERKIRFISHLVFLCYATIMLLFIWHSLPYKTPIDSLQDWVRFFAPFSLAAVFYWRHRRSFSDGSLQGYLNGYMDALERMALQEDAQEQNSSKT